MMDIDKYRGCLIGGAVGDALGYTVEFDDDSHIFGLYGENGITEYSLVNGIAPVSDDTQMTLFTANGLLLTATTDKAFDSMSNYLTYIALCYKDWLKTQATEQFGFEPPSYSWLNNVPEMNHSREPGRTCIGCLMHDSLGSVAEPKNNSKGCGGVMRVAPIGLYFDEKQYSAEQIDMIGAEAAALTHGHELGYIPAAMLVHIIRILSHSETSTVIDAVIDAKAAISRLFPHAVHLSDLVKLIDKAITLAADKRVKDIDAIGKLGQGRVAEEALAIAVYCALKYENSFEKAIIAAVNHSGDSDSTGAITGNILGAHLGLKAIPKKFLESLELRDTVLEIADDLFKALEISEHGSLCDDTWEKEIRLSHLSEQIKSKVSVTIHKNMHNDRDFFIFRF